MSKEKQELIEFFKNAPPIVRTLSDRDRDIFLAMLDADNEPNEALKKAAETHRELIKQSDPEIIEAIEEGMASFERGEGRPAKAALEELLERLETKQTENEEKELVAAGLMRLPLKERNDDFLDLPAPQVELSVIQKVIREERDED